MVLRNTRASNYPEWYQNVISAADMAEVSVSPGCMVIKPWGFGFWEYIQKYMDEKFKETGHENAYFPLFIPLSFFQKEADHVEGFAKEMAIVTHSRLSMNSEGKLTPDSPLDEPLVVRPTSEAIIVDSFSKWVQSYRDLPILLNQWCNVVRWEMRPRIFLRTREFLWQEGHTAHASKEEAEEETLQMLDVYTDIVENYMAMPVIRGKKPEHEKFPGAVDTYCMEAMMQDGRALQAGTSHYLGQNFAKSNNIVFQSKEGKQEYAHTTSWGASTRLIGGLIMTHSDDEGLQAPPRVAPWQIIIIPMVKDDSQCQSVMDYVDALVADLRKQPAFGDKLRVKVDKRGKQPIDMFWEWTRKGAPLICEVGMRDVDNGKVMVKIRNKINDKDCYKKILSRKDFLKEAVPMLEHMQEEMFAKAKQMLEDNTIELGSPEEMKEYFSDNNIFLYADEGKKIGFVKGKWCGRPETETILKEMRISIRVIPFEQSGTKGKCLLTGEDAAMDVIYARSY